ncbi:YqaA family protein [Wenxinia saemankumensis]|uniref:Membrane protein YqaA, SNARE-associated domain n=1 Tax=Wenxinia saemankumensis TaxID=1447782 RepID=A0A1M6A1P3_9RHOB|nr:YqaA family protein [Wenxinia saemankumensis]SHI30392.1 membrane protein YqaA, SNARE-associated domain [Wenxinia saemankumensis]
MLRTLYDRTLALAGHRHALWFLAAIAFVESSVFPIPPDVLIIPMVLARPRRAWLIAAVATLSSVAGALLGYYIGWGLFESVGRPVLDFYHKAEDFDAFALRYNEWGAWAVLVAGVTPFPFKVITIASGATGLSLPVFVLASLVARGLRFFLVAGLLRVIGAPAKAFIEERLGLVFTIFCVCLFGGFALVRYM